jgi:lysophospholipase L1-like esterase
MSKSGKNKIFRRDNMKKIIAFLLLVGVLIFASCELKDPTQPEITTINPQALPLSKMVAVGASFTAGFQSGGLVDEFQKSSFPYLIEQQMGRADQFQMGLLAAPGFGSANLQTGEAFGPLKFENGQIVPGDPVPGGIGGISALLFAGGNAELTRPYDNLGIPGADLNDILTTTAFDPTTDTGNPFFDLTLRNPNLGNTTQLDQAILLQPSLVLLPLLGGNDVLGAATNGTAIEGVTITPQADYENRLNQIVDRIQDETRAIIITTNIPDITALPYVNILDPFVYKTIPFLGINTPVPVVFDATFQPILFDTTLGLYLPLLAEEGLLTGGSPINHLLLPFLSQYQATGLGVPDSMAIADVLIANNIPPAQAAAIAQLLVLGMQAAGLNPSGVSIPGTLTLTEEESTTIADAISGYNSTIVSIAQSKGVAVVDLATPFNNIVANPGTDGVTALFVLLDQNTTMFSLDGVHVNDAGQALIAREYITKINELTGLGIPNVNPGDFTGQYSGTSLEKLIAPGVIEAAVQLYLPKQLRQQ